MVTAKTQYNLKNAEEYFEEHRAVGDYYDEGHRVAGEWFGLGAQRFGLVGKVHAEDFLRLCENQHPSSGETLTQRLNTTRTVGGENAPIGGYSSTSHSHLRNRFPSRVSSAKMNEFLKHTTAPCDWRCGEFEAFTAARVRVGGAQSDRLTGNFAAALFTHDTSHA